MALLPSDSRCGGQGGFEVFQHDPLTPVDASEGVICNGAIGAAGATGPRGPAGINGSSLTAVPLFSIDSRCGGQGLEVFQRDPLTSSATSQGVICNGAPDPQAPQDQLVR